MTNIPVNQRHLWGGSSESAVLLGVSRFQTRFELYHAKKGSIPPTEDTERMAAGRHLEPAIAAWASEKWSWPVRNVTKYDTHPTLPRIGASLDFEDSDGCPVEIKNVDFLVFRDNWAADGDVIIDAPLDYLIQVQHQLMCRPDKPHGWLVACVAGNSLKRMKIERHPGTIARIEREWTDFWADVDADREPKPDFQADAATIAHLYASAAAGKVIDMTGHNRMPELCAEYKAGGEMEKAGKARKDAAKGEMIMLIREIAGDVASGGIDGDKAKIMTGGFSISMNLIKPCDVAYTRTGYVDFRVFPKKDK
jgi:predicted phage-related endonuclease